MRPQPTKDRKPYATEGELLPRRFSTESLLVSVATDERFFIICAHTRASTWPSCRVAWRPCPRAVSFWRSQALVVIRSSGLQPTSASSALALILLFLLDLCAEPPSKKCADDTSASALCRLSTRDGDWE